MFGEGHVQRIAESMYVIHNKDELAVSNGNKLNLLEMFPAKLKSQALWWRLGWFHLSQQAPACS